MRSWAWVWVLGIACGCGETSDGAARTGDSTRDGGGGAATGATGGNSAGTSSAGGNGQSAGGGSAAGGTNAGSGGRNGATATGGSSTDASADAPRPHDATLDARVNLPDGGCVALPRTEAPDTSQFCTAQLCRTGTGWEVIATDPRGFYMGHLFWVLTIGDQYFIESGNVGGDLTMVGFAIGDAEYAGLKAGEQLHAFYGTIPHGDAGLSPTRGRYCGDFI